MTTPTPSADPAGRPRSFDAVIFDMDGVVTDTASVHAVAWKQMFDDYLRQRSERTATAFREFTPGHDYRTFVDGKPRYQGVAAFLESRAITLPPGTPADPAGAETICGLGNRKNELFNRTIESSGARVYETTVALIRALRSAGVAVGLATSSRNSSLILERTGTGGLFATVVDGLVSERRGLRGKPQPDIFVAAAADLGVRPARAVVVEDAVSGVRAGAAGGFALVIGVAREHNGRELQENGADMVVRDLADVSMEAIDRGVRQKGAAA